MRRLASIACLLAAVACSVPDKQPSTSDGGTDAMPPDGGGDLETSITSAPDEFSNLGNATFEFTSNVAGATFECSIDGDTAVECSSPYTRALGDGDHTFAVRAVDGAGAGDPTPAEHVWMIDTVAPNTQLVGAPPNADNSVLVTFTFRGTEDNVTFDCSLDGGSYMPCTSGIELGPLADGSHSFAVRAHDRAGNVDTSPAIHAWSIDTTTPDTQIVMGPSGSSTTQSATFTFVSPDAGGGATFECALDGAGFTPCTSPQTFASLPEGPHTFAVRVRDAVGNADPTPATRTWTVDLSAPDTMITGGPSGMVRVASAAFTFTSTEANATFACSLDEAPFAPCTSPYNATGLAQGPHTFAVKAIDVAGHEDPTPATRAWEIDTTAPQIAIVAGPVAGGESGPRITFMFTVSEGTVACALGADEPTPCTSPQVMNLPAGAHQFRIRATDGAGNVATATRAFTVACAPPTAAGAAGLLHLDDADQTLANAVGGGAPAVLGDTDAVEPGDPAFTGGRFGGALAFTALEGDHVTWSAMLGAMPALTIELWARPEPVAGTRALLASGDDNLTLAAMAASPTTVRFVFAVASAGGQPRSAVSAPVGANAWHHVVASMDEDGLRLWVDGARVEIAMSVGAGPSLDAIRLGGSNGGAYQGLLDEVWLAQTPVTDDDTALARYCPM